MVLSPSGRGAASVTSPMGLLGDMAIVVVVVVVVDDVDEGDSRLLEFASPGDSTFRGRRKDDGLLRKELDGGVRDMVKGAATRNVGDPGADDDIIVTFSDAGGGGGGGGGGTDGTDVTACTGGNRGGGNGRLWSCTRGTSAETRRESASSPALPTQSSLPAAAAMFVREAGGRECDRIALLRDIGRPLSSR